MVSRQLHKLVFGGLLSVHLFWCFFAPINSCCFKCHYYFKIHFLSHKSVSAFITFALPRMPFSYESHSIEPETIKLKPNNKTVDNFSKLSELQRGTLWACKMLILMSDENGSTIFYISVEDGDTIYLTQLYWLTL